MNSPILTSALKAGICVSLGIHMIAALGLKCFWHSPAQLPSAEEQMVDIAFVSESEAEPVPSLSASETPATPSVTPIPARAEPVMAASKSAANAPSSAPTPNPEPVTPVVVLAGVNANAATIQVSSAPTNRVALAAPAPAAPTAPINSSAKERGPAAVSITGSPSLRATPLYRKNPEPAYPASARRRRQQGVVILSVIVTAQGRASRVEVRLSSGFSVLDEAAVRAVRDWEFQPARVGTVPLESEIEVPVRFKLSE